MPDMMSPNPLVMTHFEFIAFVNACAAVVLALAMDFWRARRAGAGVKRP